MSNVNVNQQRNGVADLVFRKPGSTPETRFEKVHTVLFQESSKASISIAREIANTIRMKNYEGKPCVLGLATGSSPIKVYDELVRLHQQEGLSFANVVTFNLDEYFPMKPHELQSYVRFMHENLFDHIDIPKENINIPLGTLKNEEVRTFCEDYERKIASYGGIDLQVLGIGRTGHIGFNEPGSHINSSTRMIVLDHITRMDAADAFGGIEKVPSKAITMGIDTIMNAHRVILMAWGDNKAKVVQKTVEGDMTDEAPATYLQRHPNATFVLDEAAASSLTRQQTPWLVGEVSWDEMMTKRAVIWLCQKVKKPILKLTDRDYNENGLAELRAIHGSAYDINIHLFNVLQRTITGWPGGKPFADDTFRPERAEPEKKRAVLFSPHPDDDVISMGGTFIRLVDQGHEVHVAYQTSGNIAVNDEEVVRFADTFREIGMLQMGWSKKKADEYYQSVLHDIQHKKDGEVDAESIRQIKGLIRRGEARAGCRYVGITDDQAHFLDLPFYESGTVKKFPPSEKDIELTVDLLRTIKPHQVYAAGDLSDPHGTHRVCLDIILEALQVVKEDDWAKDCWVWLYRGAWQEWNIEDIDKAVPLSPQEVMRKRNAIFKHQSQKDGIVFPGEDVREFWQRAEFRNNETANIYNQLGFAEYEAMEAFKRYVF